MPEHILVFGDRAPIPPIGMEFDGISGGILIQLGARSPKLGPNVGRIFRPFGDGLDLHVAVDTDTSTSLLLAGR